METQQNQSLKDLSTNRARFNLGFLFLSIGLLVSLITSVVSFLQLVFATLEKKFPDVLNANYVFGYSTYSFEGMRMALATLIIFFPIFIVVSFYWNKHKNTGLGDIDETIRKWLLYVLLFLSSLVIAIDLVTLIKYFVSGEITIRFIWKVLVTLLVASFVGVYYIFELKGRERYMGMKVGLWSAIKASVWVILAISFAFCVMGSPMKQRDLRLDDRRVQDLQSIQWSVINFWQKKEKLPEDLSELSDPISSYMIPVDPEFQKGYAYEYSIVDVEKNTFELCATFSEVMPKGWQEYGGGKFMPMYTERDVAMSSYPYPGGGMNQSWDHGEGRTCFERTIDPDIYPPFDPEPMDIKINERI